MSAMRWKDIMVDWNKKRVSIYIPVSKCDQQGLGVRRTLQCCSARTCQKWCPWKLWLELWKAFREEDTSPQEFAFQDSEGKKLSKAKMVRRMGHVYMS